jgi:hypothetical protein
MLVLLTLLWLGLTWGLQALRRLSQELDQIEGGTREPFEQHPRELLRLTGSSTVCCTASANSVRATATLSTTWPTV